MTEHAPSLRGMAAPRALTARTRAELNLPVVARVPYRWTFACVVVGTACLPLVLAKLWTLAMLAVLLGFVIFPMVRWFEHREASWREDVYRTGIETTGQVVDIEPPGATRRDHILRVEFFADGIVVRASVIGCPLVRKGLKPSEDVVVIYDAKNPSRCLIVERAPPEIVDAIFDD
jgi:hypothetical protein